MMYSLDAQGLVGGMGKLKEVIVGVKDEGVTEVKESAFLGEEGV